MKEEVELCELQKIVHKILKDIRIKGYDYEDLYMEGLLTAHKAIKDFEPNHGMKLSSYIYMRVYRRYISIYRLNTAQKRKIEQKILFESTTLSENGAFYGKNIYEDPLQELEIEQKELKEELNQTMKKVLNEKEYLIMKAYLSGNTIEEIAKKFNLKTRQVSNKMYYIRKKLKKNKDIFEKSKKML